MIRKMPPGRRKIPTIVMADGGPIDWSKFNYTGYNPPTNNAGMGVPYNPLYRPPTALQQTDSPVPSQGMSGKFGEDPANLPGVSTNATKQLIRQYQGFANAPISIPTDTQPAAGNGPTNIPPIKKGINWSGISSSIGNAVDKASPYFSNIVNAFRHAPRPIPGTPDNYITLNKVNLDDERYQVGRETNANSADAERTAPGNTATAIKQFNLGQKLNRISGINEKERNQNVGISNQESMINNQISQGNTKKVDEFNQSQVERSIAEQREQSANVANAGQKYTEIQNQKSAAALDMDKTRLLMGMYDKSGVIDRYRTNLKAKGEKDPLGKNFTDLDQKKLGGMIRMKKLPAMRPLKPLKPMAPAMVDSYPNSQAQV